MTELGLRICPLEIFLEFMFVFSIFVGIYNTKYKSCMMLLQPMTKRLLKRIFSTR